MIVLRRESSMIAIRYVTCAAIAFGGTALAGPTFAAGHDPNVFQVFFPLNSTELDVSASQEIARAVDAWEQTGLTQVSVIGHSDTSGSADYNRRLSQQRASAVEGALLREGIPANLINTRASGEDDLLVSTSDGIILEDNRRVEIVIPKAEQQEEKAEIAPAPEPVPVAPAPAPPVPVAPVPAAPAPEPDVFTFALGPVWGKNFGENDNGAENDLVGAELTFRVLPSFLGGVSLSQMGLWAFNSIDDGLTGRTVASLDFAPDFGIFRPTLALNGGLVYGEGVQDGFVVGPELRFDVAPIAGFNIGLMVAYDYQFETDDFEEGIVWTGLDLGIRF